MKNCGFEDCDDVASLGINGKFKEFSAAFAVAGMACLDDLIRHSREIRDTYGEGLADLPGVSLHAPAMAQSVNPHDVIVMIDPRACPLNRDQVMRTLGAENILARQSCCPDCQPMEPCASQQRQRRPGLRAIDDVAAKVLAMPASSTVSLDNVWLIRQRIRDALGQYKSVWEWIQQQAGSGSIPTLITVSHFCQWRLTTHVTIPFLS